MNYYPFHLGDYAAHTAHLEPMEDLAYRRMLDLYYRTEKPLPREIEQIARLIRMKGHEQAINQVVDEFFEDCAEGWMHVRCDAEIAKMQDKQAKAKASAAASVKARSTSAQRTLNERSTDAELPTPTPTPYSVPDGTGAADAAPTARDLVFANGVPLLTVAGVSEKNARSMLAGLCKRNGDVAVANALAECAKAQPIEPVSWLQSVLAGKAPASKQQAIEDRNRAVADAWIPPELRGTEPQEAN